MINLFSWFIIPALTVLMPGKTSWIKSNFSVATSQPPGQFFLILWGLITGSYFYLLLKKTIGQAAPFIRTEKEIFLTDLAVFLLIFSVILPYTPIVRPFLSTVHVACAFVASALLYLIFLLLNFKMYFFRPDSFRTLTVSLLCALPVCLLLFFMAGNMISSALEIFFTVFCCLWIRLFYFKVCSVGETLQLKQGIEDSTA